MNDNCWLKEHCNQRDCNTFCMRYYKLNILYDNSLIPLNRRKHIALLVDDDGSDIEAFTKLKSIEDNILDFINNGKSLFIYSTYVGNGKTSWTLRMVETYFNKIWYRCDLSCKVLFISVPRFLLELKSNISKESEYITHIMNNVLNCDLVIWDDIATKLGTEFEVSHLLSIIDTRINNGKSNMFTSNLCGVELTKALGDRLYSRIVNYSDYVIELKGKDKRGIKNDE